MRDFKAFTVLLPNNNMLKSSSTLNFVFWQKEIVICNHFSLDFSQITLRGTVECE